MAFNEKQLSKVSKNNKTEVDRNSNALTYDMQKVFEALTNGLYSSEEIMTLLGYTYAEIPISTAEIETLGTPFEILPAPGANKYYEYKGVLEYKGNTTGFTVPTSSIIIIGDDNLYSGTYIYKDILTDPNDSIFDFNSAPQGNEGTGTGTNFAYKTYTNSALKIFTYNADNPSGGDGTILIKIWYKVRTFGSEL